MNLEIIFSNHFYTNFKSQVKSSFKFIKNDTDIAYKDWNFRIENRVFITCVGETVGGHPPAKNQGWSRKFKKNGKLKKSKNFSFFIIQHDSKIRDTGNRFKIDSGFSCNFGRHKSECVCIHEILSLLFKI